MPLWSSLYRHWTFIAIPVMLTAMAALISLILSLIATVRHSLILRVPLAPRQEIEFAEAGTVVLNMEAPRFSTRFAHLEFELTGIGGDTFPGHRRWARSRTSGISLVRVALLSYDIPRPGRFVLRIGGIDAQRPGDERHSIVFTRPNGLKTVAFILGIILSAGLLITSLVFFVLRLQDSGSGA